MWNSEIDQEAREMKRSSSSSADGDGMKACTVDAASSLAMIRLRRAETQSANRRVRSGATSGIGQATSRQPAWLVEKVYEQREYVTMALVFAAGAKVAA